ncbi:Uncharacterised protein [uncultured archaeon]|nr:Uncharacterised protein [uncultured archaeon]
MLYVRIELWPGGDRDRRKVLGEMAIANDCSGSMATGNYNVWHRTDPKPEKMLDDPQKPGQGLFLRNWFGKMKPARVENHPRQAVTVWHLIRKAIEASGFREKS